MADGTRQGPPDSYLRRAAFVLREEGVRSLLRRTAHVLRWSTRRTRPHYAVRSWLARRRHADTGIDPLAVVHVDPARIEHVAGTIVEPDTGYHLELPDCPFDDGDFGAVVGGDWDRTDARFESLSEPTAIRRRFEDGVQWEETALYRRYADRIDRGEETYGCSSRAELDAKLAGVDRLYDRIRTDGYRTQAALRGKPTKEITVSLGRDGEPCWHASGRHRLAIAKTLELDAVPVLVMGRHPGRVYPSADDGADHRRDAGSRASDWEAETTDA